VLTLPGNNNIHAINNSFSKTPVSGGICWRVCLIIIDSEVDSQWTKARGVIDKIENNGGLKKINQSGRI